MIRYRLPGFHDPVAATSGAHPALARLAGRGPWSCVDTPDGVVLTRGTAVTWGPWVPGVGGLDYALADPLPACDPQALTLPGPAGEGSPVALRCGIVLPVRPAAWDGSVIGLDGQLGAPASRYGREVAALYDRILAAGDLPPTDPQAIAVARMALQSATSLTDELIHAWGLLSSGDVVLLFLAASSIPKADAGGGPCSAAPPASTPPA